MKKTDSISVSSVFKRIFCTFGLPKELVADNGPPFNSNYIRKLCKNNNISYRNSPEYNPCSNGSAERAVQTVKSGLTKLLLDKRNQGLKIEELILKFLFNYGSTPSSVTNKTPTELLLNYLPRNKLTLLKPESDSEDQIKEEDVIDKPTLKKRLTAPIQHKPDFNIPKYNKGDKVWYRVNSPLLAKWIPATIISNLSPLIYNIILERGNIRKAHLSQLKDKVENKFPKYFVTHPDRNVRQPVDSPIALRTRSRLLRRN